MTDRSYPPPCPLVCLWLALAAMALALSGCGTRDTSPEPPQPGAGGRTLADLGEWAIWIGGLGLLLSAVGAVLAPPGLRARVASVAMAAGALIAGGWLLGLIDRWLAVVMITAVCLSVLAAAAWLWGRRGAIVDAVEEWAQIDLDGDPEPCDRPDGSAVALEAVQPADTLGWTRDGSTRIDHA